MGKILVTSQKAQDTDVLLQIQSEAIQVMNCLSVYFTLLCQHMVLFEDLDMIVHLLTETFSAML